MHTIPPGAGASPSTDAVVTRLRAAGCVFAEDEAALLSRIEAGEVDEHPAYEHYLAARILADTRDATRAALAESLQEANRT